MKNNQIEFLRKKDFKYIKEIGQGGTGKTILIEDEIINEVFVCKKYSPYYSEDKNTYFKYFIDEIKILHRVYHKNIVRVFNYYLYPERITGYILMEYVIGEAINQYLLKNPDKVEEIFIQTIEGFRYLEEIKILHRDIRPENILISEEGIVKIIDFGFGKSIEFATNNKSISLNWRYVPPEDFEREVYETKTEVYFIGKLFEEIIQEIENINFKYSTIISKMIQYKFENRIASFLDIYREIINIHSGDYEFSYDERLTYKYFVDRLMPLIIKMPYGTEYSNNIDEIIRNLEHLYKNSILEDYVQNNNKLISIFINGKYTYSQKREISVVRLLSFIQLLKSSLEDKRKIILNNLWERFDTITKYIEVVDDLPF